MLSDPNAVEIISRARQANVARPDSPDRYFDNIVDDFFLPEHFDDRKILELGPGQYDFARRAQKMGASVDVIDLDQAVLELGHYLNFTTIEADLAHWNPRDCAGRYDGLFCKGAISGLWHESPDEAAEHVVALDAIVGSGGWGWIAPWNGGSLIKKQPEKVVPLLNAQRAAFESVGWRALDFTTALANRYGAQYQTPNNVLFVKNLAVPDRFFEA